MRISIICLSVRKRISIILHVRLIDTVIHLKHRLLQISITTDLGRHFDFLFISYFHVYAEFENKSFIHHIYSSCLRLCLVNVNNFMSFIAIHMET